MARGEAAGAVDADLSCELHKHSLSLSSFLCTMVVRIHHVGGPARTSACYCSSVCLCVCVYARLWVSMRVGTYL